MDVCDWLSNNRAGVSFLQMNNWTNLVIFSTGLIWSNHIELEWEYLMEYTSLLHSSLSQNCLLLELAGAYTTEKQCQLPSGGIPRKVLEDLGMHTSCSESKITIKSFLLLEYCVVLWCFFFNFPKHQGNFILKLCVDSLPACERVGEIILWIWLSTVYYSEE